MTLQTRIWTADELARLPDDGWRYELVRGELRKMAPAGYNHGRIAYRLTLRLGGYIDEHGLGQGFAAETGFLLARNPDSVRAPDLGFVAPERAQMPLTTEGFWPGAPDLAVEVVSPGDSHAEVAEKVAAWLAAGTGLVMVVDPRSRQVTVYRGPDAVQVYAAADILDAEPVVPGWRMPVPDLFGS